MMSKLKRKPLYNRRHSTFSTRISVSSQPIPNSADNAENKFQFRIKKITKRDLNQFLEALSKSSLGSLRVQIQTFCLIL